MTEAPTDAELKQLLTQTLQDSGTLGKIKAQLRAAVYLACEDAEHFKKNPPLVDHALRNLMDSEQGQLCTSVLRDTLEQLQLHSTLAVFDSEISHQFPSATPRTQTPQHQLIERLDLSPDSLHEQGGLLMALIHAQTTAGARPGLRTKASLSKESEVDEEHVAPSGSGGHKQNGVLPQGTGKTPLMSSFSTKSSLDESPRTTQNNGNNLHRGLPPMNTTSTSGGGSRLPPLSNSPTPTKQNSLAQILAAPRQSTFDKSSTSTTTSSNNSGSGDTTPTNNSQAEDKSSARSEKSQKSSAKIVNGEPKQFVSNGIGPVLQSMSAENKTPNAASNRGPSVFRKTTPRDDSKSNESVSEEIVEDLEIDDLLHSGRSKNSVESF